MWVSVSISGGVSGDRLRTTALCYLGGGHTRHEDVKEPPTQRGTSPSILLLLKLTEVPLFVLERSTLDCCLGWAALLDTKSNACPVCDQGPLMCYPTLYRGTSLTRTPPPSRTLL